jgi:hypothetical protein
MEVIGGCWDSQQQGHFENFNVCLHLEEAFVSGSLFYSLCVCDGALCLYEKWLHFPDLKSFFI